ncbi:MAG: sn-glycerol-3-phosphate transporter ATP-binding protein UgpC, partial [Actinomycetota bacterium]
MNLVEVDVVDGGVSLAGTTIPIDREVLARVTSGRALLGVRPEDLDVVDSGVAVTVELVEMLGADTYIYGRLAEGPLLVARVDPSVRPDLGSVIHVAPSRTYLFAADTDQPLLG